MDTRLTHEMGPGERGTGRVAYHHPYICTTCNGEGMIYRPVKTVTKRVTRSRYNEANMTIDNYQVAEDIEIGGLDACPECTAASESHVQ